MARVYLQKGVVKAWIDERAYKKEFTRLGKIAEDLRPVWPAIDKMWRKSRETIFKLKSAGRYPPLKNPQEKISAVGFAYPLLYRTGRLANALTKKTSRDRRTVFDKQNLIWIISLHYAKYHQFGTRKIPARPFAFIGPEAGGYEGMTEQTGSFARRALATIEEYITRKSNRSNFSV